MKDKYVENKAVETENNKMEMTMKVCQPRVKDNKGLIQKRRVINERGKEDDRR